MAKSKTVPSRPPAKAVRLRQASTTLDWLKEARRQAEEAYAAALGSESYVAARQFLAEARRYVDEIGAIEKAQAAAAPSSEEEFVKRFVADLASLPEPYLEMAIAEYMRRHPGVRLVADA